MQRSLRGNAQAFQGILNVFFLLREQEASREVTQRSPQRGRTGICRGLARLGTGPVLAEDLTFSRHSGRYAPPTGHRQSSRQVGEAQLRWYLPAQTRCRRGGAQVGEAAQVRRYLPAQLVVAEDQPCQVGEAAQLRRYLPAQVVVAEDQTVPGWRGCPGPQVSPRSRRCSRGSSLSRLERLPSSAGISPLKSLSLEVPAFSRLERLPSSGGISPLKPLAWRSSL